MSEIKLLFCALTGCTSPKTVHPEIAPCTLPIYSNNNSKNVHTPGAHLGKIVHPAVEMCALGAGCTLNFGHRNAIGSHNYFLIVKEAVKKDTWKALRQKICSSTLPQPTKFWIALTHFSVAEDMPYDLKFVSRCQSKVSTLVTKRPTWVYLLHRGWNFNRVSPGVN